MSSTRPHGQYDPAKDAYWNAWAQTWVSSQLYTTTNALEMTGPSGHFDACRCERCVDPELAESLDLLDDIIGEDEIEEITEQSLDALLAATITKLQVTLGKQLMQPLLAQRYFGMNDTEEPDEP